MAEGRREASAADAAINGAGAAAAASSTRSAGPLVGAWRLLRATLHVLHGLWIIRSRFHRLDESGRHERIQWWSREMLRLLGIDLVPSGLPKPGASLLVSNHVSWLDIIALHSVIPQARFVSKADVKDWPVIGRLVTGAGTLYIERERKRDALRVVHQMAEVMGQGGTVAVFPEGTTSDGRAVLPFHANLLQAAIATGVPVQAAVLRFSGPGHAVSPAAEYVGDTTLAQSLWRVATAHGLAVHVLILPPQATAHADRRSLAEALRTEIAGRLADALRAG
jgi:1-acyl-sn-glycerol-3-phosphate acyltransferase